MLTKLTVLDFDDIFDIMKQAFPSDEYRTETGQRAVFSDPAYCVYGQREDGRLVGFIATWEYDGLVFIEHFAVASDLRGRGIGAKMLAELVEGVKKTVCLEVEPPCDEITRRRIAFYERCGFFYNDYDYTQPAMDVGKNPIPLRIMTYGNSVDTDGFLQIKRFLYKNIYKVEA